MGERGYDMQQRSSAGDVEPHQYKIPSSAYNFMTIKHKSSVLTLKSLTKKHLTQGTLTSFIFPELSAEDLQLLVDIVCSGNPIFQKICFCADKLQL